jgi:O-antigen ligase
LARLIRCFFWTLPFMALAVAAFLAGFDWDYREDLFVEARSLATTAVIVGAVFMSVPDRAYVRWIGWSACLAVTVFTAGRMGTAALLMLPVINPVGRSVRHKLLAIAFIVVLSACVLMSSTFQKRFFWDEGGGVSQIIEGDFDSRGRFDVWPLLLEEALLRPWLGHGVGSCQQIVPLLWQPTIAFPHNDYLRVGYEYGIIGLTLFLFVVGWQMLNLRWQIRHSDGVVRQAFVASWLGMAAFLLYATTDNPITYILFFMDPLFALMGAAYGVARTEELRRPAAAVQYGSPLPELAMRLR